MFMNLLLHASAFPIIIFWRSPACSPKRLSKWRIGFLNGPFTTKAGGPPRPMPWRPA
jgi:hypothetical protein